MSGITRIARGRFGFRARYLALLCAWACVCPAVAHDQVPAPPQNHPVLLRGGDLYTIAGGVLPATDLLMVDGKILDIGPDLPVIDSATVIDVRGHRVYPGLIAPHSTLGLIEIGAVRATNDRAEVGAVTPEVATHIAYNPDSELIPTVRSHGITTAQIVPLGAGIRGRSFITHLDGWTKEQSAVRMIDGQFVSWPNVAVGTGWWIEGSAKEQKKKIVEEQGRLRDAFVQARAYSLARRADSNLPVDIRWEAMRPLFEEGQTLYVAADDMRQIRDAIEFAGEMELRIVIVGGREAYAVTDLLREREIPVVVGTTSVLPMREDDPYDLPYRLPQILHDAGVRFCLTHINWGAWDMRNLPFQAGMAVAFGLPEEVALRSMTLSTAEILGLDDRLGSLEIGKEATLFVSKGDVMDMLEQEVTHMFIRGRKVDLDNRHRELYRKYRKKPAGGASGGVP